MNNKLKISKNLYLNCVSEVTSALSKKNREVKNKEAEKDITKKENISNSDGKMSNYKPWIRNWFYNYCNLIVT